MAPMFSAMSIAQSGMLAGVARLEASASRIADALAEPESSAPPVDLAGEVVGVLEASLVFKANLAVFKTADEMTKRLLDITA
jgi:flagellar basal body rod protein FlgC